MKKAYKPIAQSIWNDQKYPYLPGEAQLAWFFLFTHHQHGQIGVFKASLAGLFEEINVNGWWTPARFDGAVKHLEKAEMVELDRERLLIAFPKFFSAGNGQNFPQNYNQVVHVLRQFGALPSCALVTRLFNSFVNQLQSHAKRFGKRFSEQLTNCLLDCSPNSSPNSSTKGLVNGSIIDIVSFSSLLRLRIEEKESDIGKAQPWPKDFALSDKLIAVGRGFKINPHAEFQKAKDWCKANGRCYADYEAFLRNWFRRASERRAP